MMHKGNILDRCNEYNVIDCEECGFVHIDPVPSEADLEKTYREEYYSVEKPEYIARSEEDLVWWNICYKERYETFEEHLPPERRRILDVGSGPGYFLLHGKERGWKTAGIEPSEQASEHSRSLGLYIVNSFLNRYTAEGLGQFDVIHMSEVLEHIPGPADLVQLCYSMLKPGGLLCAIVPNEYSHFQKALKNACNYKPWWIAPPHHINYFNLDSLKKLVMNNGFEIIVSEATFPMDMFLLMGDNYVGNDDLGRACHMKRKTMEMNLTAAGLSDIKRKLYRQFAEMGIGREVILYAKKI